MKEIANEELKSILENTKNGGLLKRLRNSKPETYKSIFSV